MKKPSNSTPRRPRDRYEVPTANAGAVIPRKWKVYYGMLQELRDKLLAQNRNLLHEAREPVATAGSHVAESGTDEFERGLHFSLLATEQNALHEVEAALRRIETGTYGICLLSGKPIPATRLKAVPWARYTAQIEGELERNSRRGSIGARKEPETPINGHRAGKRPRA